MGDVLFLFWFKNFCSEITELNSNIGSVYYLGIGSTMDVSKKLPDLYLDLTSDNFIVMPGTIGWAQGKIEQHSGSGPWAVKYNNSTGILSVSCSYNPGGHGIASTGQHKVYVITGNIKNV